jgi:transcriptional regulator with GAF, ATPase, and Fis domain
VRLEDLGSSNAVLVNGRPVRETLLAVGDEVSIGSTVLVVALWMDEETPVAVSRSGPPPTATLHLGQATYLQAVPSMKPTADPRTVSDLHALFAMSRQFSAETLLAGLIERFAEHLRERFRPMELWVAEYIRGEEQLVFHAFPGAASMQQAPHEALLESLRSNAGFVIPNRVGQSRNRHLETTMVAPIAYGDDLVGAVAVRTQLPHGVYDGGDLHYLLALTSTLAPFIRAVERLEQLQRDWLHAGVSTPGAATLIGQSPRLDRVREVVRQAAASRLPVILFGESGTGKEVVGRMIHDLSLRASQPYVTVNCAAIPEELFESEMFGHEKGAFTGAAARRVGRFEEAHGGTIFLDEIPDLSAANQARMLRVLETGLFYPVGATREVRVDARVIAATNRSLPELMAGGKFRHDLYYRLQGFVIELPPLRGIAEDIPLIADGFLKATHGRAPRAVTAIAPEAMQLLQAWSWPGNVRELRACIERAACVAKSDTIMPQDLSIAEGPTGLTADPQEPLPSLAEIEKQHIQRVLHQCQGNVRAAARILGISHVTLYAKINRSGIET